MDLNSNDSDGGSVVDTNSTLLRRAIVGDPIDDNDDEDSPAHQLPQSARFVTSRVVDCWRPDPRQRRRRPACTSAASVGELRRVICVVG